MPARFLVVNVLNQGYMHKLFIVLLVLLAAACTRTDERTTSTAHSETDDANTLIFVTHNGPTTYYYNGDNELAGLEYDLATLFVKDFAPEYQLKFLVVNSVSDVIPSLLKGRAHIAAANLSITRLRQELVQFSTPYQQTQQQLVTLNEENTKQNRPIQVKDFNVQLANKKLAVPLGTSFEERLIQLKKSQPALQWQSIPNTNSELLLSDVANGTLDYTMADSHLVSIMQNYYPNLTVAAKVGEADNLAWAFSKQANPALVKKVNAFFAKIKKDGTLKHLIDRYYGHSERLNTQDVTVFLARSQSILPNYAALFKQAQEQTGLDWRLIAAVSYRESHWDPLNTSPTGVRGMMMLTENTAKLMGVTDRLDPVQSIPAGAKYLVKMIEKIPETVPEPDRTYLALAAYNIGYAHLLDARTLAMRLKLNPDRWSDVKKTLLMLRQPDYYTTLKYGYANGSAPVIFVESVRSYLNILEYHQPSHPANEQINVANLSK